jgi:hypothetical protein
MSVVFNAQANAPASSNAASTGGGTDWAIANSAENQAAANQGDEEGFDFNFDMPDDMAMGFPPAIAGAVQNFVQAVGPGNGSEAQGIVGKIDGDKITLDRSNRVINVNASTKYGDANGDLTKADIKVGDRIMVLGKVETDKSLTARWVLKLEALPSLEAGQITSVNAAGNQFKFKVGSNEWTATVTANTTINKNGQKAALSDLAANDNVRVVGKADKTAKTIEATRVDVGQLNRGGPGKGPMMGRGLGGTVKSVDAANNSLVVTQKVNGTDTDVTVKVDSTTKYGGQNVKGLSDFKAGDQVFVVGEKQSDNSVKAAVVSKAPANMRGPNGQGGFPFGGPGGRGPRGGQQNSQPQASPTPNL